MSRRCDWCKPNGKHLCAGNSVFLPWQNWRAISTKLWHLKGEELSPYFGREMISSVATVQNSNPNARTVIDFQREKMPISFANITVPFFPKINDMILIRGEDPDPWVAKVLTTQERSKTVRVLYYMKDEDQPGQEFYIPYRNTRLAHDTVSWDSILGLAHGEWQGDAFELFFV